ncbi:rCG60751 [Rattus norvegicus]|uniref:RCG60751 n=1 Tax=Rattus norvegicus TaxID=10116 RepID=A6JK59_RAT|nr:rCG60751 [Rattus norvegicus]
MQIPAQAARSQPPVSKIRTPHASHCKNQLKHP